MSAIACLNNGDTHNTPIEATDAKLPIVVHHRALRTDSGGAERSARGPGGHPAQRVARGGHVSVPAGTHTVCAVGPVRRTRRTAESDWSLTSRW
ncbi:MAG: hydantoinase B/oxoprolinase family protein [Chloroflexi bacterium]|nr:hydantoinase B/oxoprolinase family protein [Chloroflexota bacterium]